MFRLKFKEVPFATLHTEEGSKSDRRLEAYVEGVGGHQPLHPYDCMYRVEIEPGQWMCWDEYEIPGMGTTYRYGIWCADENERPGHGGFWSSRPSVLGWCLGEYGPVRMVGIGNSAVRLSQCDLRELPLTHQMYCFMVADGGPCPDYGEIWFLVKDWHEHDDRFVPLEVKND